MTTTKSYFRKPLWLLVGAALGASMMILLASQAQAADFVVTNTDDSGAGSLRQAIIDANATAEEDTIKFALGQSATTIVLSSQLPTIASTGGPLTIDGENANITISGNNRVQVFTVASGAGLTLNKLTVANGRDVTVGGIFTSGGTLTVSNSTFSGNIGVGPQGGAIVSDDGSVTVSNSTFSGNCSRIEGGGIAADDGSTLEVSNSTFSGNCINHEVVSGDAAAIWVQDSTADITNSTITGSTGTVGEPGAVENAGNATLTFSNTLLANNAGGNCSGTITDGGGNLDDGETCGFTAASSKSNTPAGLDPDGLKNNGGPTQTIALQENSAAIDAAVGCPPPTTDQRGVSRPQGSACDIGAFEFVPPQDTEAPNLTATHTGANANGWNKTSPVTLNVSASDSGSGLAGAPTCKDGTTDLPLTAGTAGTWTASVSGEGTHSISCSVSDNATNTTTASDTIKIDTKAPSASCSVTPSRLRTAANNHKLVDITASVTFTDPTGGSGLDGGFTLDRVESNQADIGLGPGDVAGDIQGWKPGTADTSGQLRAERYGGSRIYTLIYQAKDLAGNTAECKPTVTVPKGG